MRAIASRLREAERQEIEAVAGQVPLDHLMELFILSYPPTTLLIDNEPAAMTGVIPESSGVGLIWFAGTALIDRRSFTFVRASRPLLRAVSRGYGLLHNYICVDTDHHYRWAAWLGFKFLDCVLSTPDGRKFIHTYHFTCPQQQSQ